MTIAAGFTFADGVMICADTEVTVGGVAKYAEQKIIPIQFGMANDGPTVAFAITGFSGQAKRAVDMCRHALGKHWSRNSGNMTNEVIRETIEASMLSFYKKFVYGHPHYKQGESWIELVVGLRSHVTSRTSLLVTDGPVVNFVHGFDFCGIGSYFARYACGKLFKYNMSLRDITLLAAHVLGQTKANVPACGKQSQFLVINNTGKLSPVSDFNISYGETHAQEFLSLTNSLIFDLANPDEDLEKVFSKFKESAKALRAYAEVTTTDWEALFESLSKEDTLSSVLGAPPNSEVSDDGKDDRIGKPSKNGEDIGS